jgi:hypothetical protein
MVKGKGYGRKWVWPRPIYCVGICLDVQRKTTKNVWQDGHLPSWESNRAPHEALPPVPASSLASLMHLKRWESIFIRSDRNLVYFIRFKLGKSKTGRSQWPRSLRHEISLPTQTLGSWFRIPFEAWMSVCIYSVFVLTYAGSVLASGWSPVQGASNFRINSFWMDTDQRA